MPNNKSPGNDGITKEFCEGFWDDLKTILLLNVNKAFKVRELTTSQKQAVIKSIETKTKINEFLKIRDEFLCATLTQKWFQNFYLSF